MVTISVITDLLVAVAVGAVIALCVSAFVFIIVAWKRRKLLYPPFPSNAQFDYDERQVDEIIFNEPSNAYVNQREVSTICVNESFDDEPLDPEWMNDISGLLPHCLAILKNCKSMTERLTALTMGLMNTKGSGLAQIVQCAKRISMRVDEMVGSLYPPLNPQLMEARANALTLAVSHLAIIARYECKNKKIPMDWIDIAMRELEEHMSILQQAANILHVNMNQSSVAIVSSRMLPPASSTLIGLTSLS